MNGTGLTIGTTVGSVIPGVGTVLGGTLGGIYDSLSSLFGGSELKKDQELGLKRIRDFVNENNVTDQAWINTAVEISQKYSGTSKYWSNWGKHKDLYFQQQKALDQVKEKENTDLFGSRIGGGRRINPLTIAGVGAVAFLLLGKK